MKSMFALRTAISAAAFLTLAGCAASPYYVSTSPKTFLPGHGPATVLGERTLAPDAVVLETPVGYERVVKLGAPLTTKIIGKDFGFGDGDLLTAATITGASSAFVPPSAVTACGAPRVDVLKTALNASTLGITSLLNRTHGMSQVCLIDADLDGRLEKAILAGVKSQKDAVPVAIEPTSYTIIDKQPMPGESAARILYRGKTGLFKGGNVSFDLEVVEGGQKLYFNNVRTKVDIDNLPQTVTLLGSIFTVNSYDPVDGKVVIDVQKGFSEGKYGITTTTSTTYIPIYIPR